MTVEAPAEAERCVADLLAARAEDDHPGLRFEDQEWSWRQVVTASAVRAALLRSWSNPGSGAPHIGVLLGNVPEYLLWLGAAALADAVVVGINPTRRGQALAGDIQRTDCGVIVTDADGARLLDGLQTGVSPERVIRIDDPGYPDLLAPHHGADHRAVMAASAPAPSHLYLLLFTSGTTGAPKAVRCTQGRLAAIAVRSARAYGFDQDDVAYCTMPLFHGNALMVLWGPSLVVGATVALARRFSASGFVADVRRYGATTFTYVGKALAYVLATPPSYDDASIPLRRGFGTEGSVSDQAAFERRFGCVLTEGYGSSEGGVAISRSPDTPIGSLGRPDGDIAIVDPDTGAERPAAHFDEAGRLLNGDQCVGEIVNRAGIGRFEGYYADEEASSSRTRGGWYWTGDLAYRDQAGFFYFAGRRGDWMRVDSENLTAGPIERVLVRHPDVATVAVYSVADPRSGDQVMAALEMLPNREFDPGRFSAFLSQQPDLGTKWVPTFVRVTGALPQTASGKVTKDPLRSEGWWRGTDPVYLRRGSTLEYAPLGESDRRQLRDEFALHGRQAHIGE
jgi:fatty-acyl-CoA synthase